VSHPRGSRSGTLLVQADKSLCTGGWRVRMYCCKIMPRGAVYTVCVMLWSAPRTPGMSSVEAMPDTGASYSWSSSWLLLVQVSLGKGLCSGANSTGSFAGQSHVIWILAALSTCCPGSAILAVICTRSSCYWVWLASSWCCRLWVWLRSS